MTIQPAQESLDLLAAFLRNGDRLIHTQDLKLCVFNDLPLVYTGMNGDDLHTLCLVIKAEYAQIRDNADRAFTAAAAILIVGIFVLGIFYHPITDLIEAGVRLI